MPARRKKLKIARSNLRPIVAEDSGGYRPRSLVLPSHPPAPAPGMALDDASGAGFGYLNTARGAGEFGLYWPGYPWLAELAQRSEYRQPVETTAREMTRKWIDFHSTGSGDKDEAIEKINAIKREFDRLDVKTLFRQAAELDGFFGVGFLYLDIKGHEDHHDKPLLIDEKTIPQGSLRGLRRIEPMWMTPLSWNARDPTQPYFYTPEAWQVIGRKTHETRLLTFISRPVPDIIKPAYNFGGIALTQLIEPYVKRWLKTVGSVNRLINNFATIVFGTEMAAVLEGATDDDLLKRIQYFAQHRDNQNIFVLDKDRELLEQISIPISGLSELQAQAQEHMAAPTHLPLVVLTGITPAGLNASSESEIDVFHGWIHATQELLFGPPLDKLLKIVQLSLFGEIDPDIGYSFRPLKELDGRGAAEITKMAADAGVAYVQAGIITPQELREKLADDPESGYDNLDTEAELPDLTEPSDDDEGDDEDDEASSAAA